MRFVLSTGPARTVRVQYGTVRCTVRYRSRTVGYCTVPYHTVRYRTVPLAKKTSSVVGRKAQREAALRLQEETERREHAMTRMAMHVAKTATAVRTHVANELLATQTLEATSLQER